MSNNSDLKKEKANIKKDLPLKTTEAKFPSLLNQMAIYCVVKTYTSANNSLLPIAISALLNRWKEGELPRSVEEVILKDEANNKSYYDSDANAARSVQKFLANISALFLIGRMNTSVNTIRADVHTGTAFFLAACFGGIITLDPNSKQSKYYFEPFLSDSDLSVMAGTIMTNPYFSQEEKDLLLELRPLLNGGDKLINWITGLLKGEEYGSKAFRNFLPDKDHLRPENLENGKLLEHIGLLYNNIRFDNAKQLEINYGRYGMPKDDKYASLDKEYSLETSTFVVNPYGIVWRGGFSYLVCTTCDEESAYKIRHLRIDRILSVNTLDAERDAVPKELSRYFDSKHHFLPEKYLREHPLMSLYKELNIVSVKLECENTSSSVIIDVFGKDYVKLKKSTRQETSTIDVNPYNDRSLITLTATVTAQYEDIREFCCEFHKIVYVSDRDSELFMDVKAYLEKSLRWYS